MKVIITGSEGFIGRALSLALQKRGIEVIGIDRKNGREAADIARYMPDDLDAVFHLAAQTSVFNTDLIQIRKDNIDTFMAVIDACAKHPNKPKLVYASSSTANPPNTTSSMKPYSYYMGKDIEALLECDAILRCAGWSNSKGCALESQCAHIYHKTIYDHVNEIKPTKIKKS